MFRDQQIILLGEKLKALEEAQAALRFDTENSESKLRLARLIKFEIAETLSTLESVLIKSIA